MIEIFEPRWRDRTVLIAKFRVGGTNSDIKIKILKSSLAGEYIVPKEALQTAKSHTMMSKQGQPISMYVVPIDSLRKVDNGV